MSQQRIFAVDDEPHILQLIRYNLEKNGFLVDCFASGEELFESNRVPDLYLLDVMLPGMDGFEICRELRRRKESAKTPVIMLTAKGEEFDRVLGLELGADDYMQKPFGVRELVARIRAVLRRYVDIKEQDQPILTGKDLALDPKKREVYKGENKIELTLKEFELLKLLMENKGNVLSRDVLLDRVWGYDYYGGTRTVDVHIRYLRQKIEDDDGKPNYIETVRGVGYKFVGGET